MPLPRSRLRAASATPSEDSASVVSSAVEPPSHVGPGWRGAASKPVVAATEDSDSDLSSLSSVHDDSDSESGSDSDSNSDSDSSEEDEEQSNHDDGSDSQRPQKARQPNRKRHAPEDSPDKSSKRRKQDGSRARELFDTAFFELFYERFGRFFAVRAPLFPKEFEQGLDYPQPTHLLRSLLSTLLEGLLDKPVDTSDQALVSALKIVLLAQAEDKFDGSECPTVEEIGFPRPAGSTSTATPIDEESGEATAVQQPEPPEPLPGTTQTANLWTLPTHKKAALFRYLAEWSLEMNDKVRDYIDKIYENRDSDKNDLSVLRVGKDRNRNLFWMLKGFPRMWRETVAGKWNLIADSPNDLRKFAETLTDDKPAQERDLRRKILNEIAPAAEESEKKRFRAERRLSRLEKQLAINAAAPLNTRGAKQRAANQTYDLEARDRELAKLTGAPTRRQTEETSKPTNTATTSLGSIYERPKPPPRKRRGSGELMALPDNYKDVPPVRRFKPRKADVLAAKLAQEQQERDDDSTVGGTVQEESRDESRAESADVSFDAPTSVEGSLMEEVERMEMPEGTVLSRRGEMLV